MRLRNPPPSRRRRRAPEPETPAALARWRRRLVARAGWPRGWSGAGWFCGVDPARASDAWVRAAHALATRPRAGPLSARGASYLARALALEPLASAERARALRDRPAALLGVTSGKTRLAPPLR